ncbi:acyl-CoA synthetase family protein [Mucilaginibacter arboris]|uniref:Acyl transferase n=1 Tax=Mucilaginibacter arboris TaxID=2682090 RepID=A0A7K1SUZ3_9SPHI|nr:acyl transferase [Mucilaginibacter arboris]MVN21104.1 acyl transferase [Mucilaginibacter arboris]
MILPQQHTIFSIANEATFLENAIQIFRFQAENCEVYKRYLSYLKIHPEEIKTLEAIPFLPIEFFKTHIIISNNQNPEVTFTSSGTTGITTSRHLVTDVSWYQKSFRKGFELFYGDIKNYAFLALLPSYLERAGSSLIYMVEDLIAGTENPDSGFYLYNDEELYQKLTQLQQQKQPTVLIGVTFALLDFIEKHQLNFPELIIMETGGMKGRRKEMIREELHQTLCQGFGVPAIHSEYGMTELLSQAYSLSEGLFHCVPWMKVLIRDTNDPFTLLPNGKTGGINVIDLANINSCSFIATQDLGKMYENRSFEVLGRFDFSDIRGCNLLVG